jgi:ferredoxin-NADP reductase
MAQQRRALLTSSELLGDDTKLLTFRMSDGELGFVGGQYIIVNTGIAIGDNKIAKRAYSIISSDEEQGEFRLAVRRIGEGPGSNFMHRREVGAELKFSGPWGKFIAGNHILSNSLVFATDTGMTAAFGLLHGKAAAESRPSVVWFAESDDYFLPFPAVIEELDRIGIKALTVTTAPPVNDDRRITVALSLVNKAVASKAPDSVFLSGDGAVVHAIRNRLLSLGLPDASIQLECFFNNPQRKASA